MKINLHVPAQPARPTTAQAVLPFAVAAIVLAGLVVLPGPVIFLATLSGVTGIGIGLAELRRHGGPEVPRLPVLPER